MSQPPSPYERSYNFTDFQSANPTTPLPGNKVDQELNNARTALNATISRLGEIQRDDGKVRDEALNLTTIAEAVSPVVSNTAILAISNAGSAQVTAVNAAGSTQVSNVNSAASAGVASINAAIANPMVTTVLTAEQNAVAGANTATTKAALATTQANLATQAYLNTHNELIAAELASSSAQGYAAAAANSQASAATEAGNAQVAAYEANASKNDAYESKLAALDAKASAEAAANTAQSIVNDGAAAITAQIQPYLDDAAASATSANNSANDALGYKTQAAASATNASNSASSAASSATAAAASAASVAVQEAPIDGQQYARKDGGWSVVAGGGGSFTGGAVSTDITIASGDNYATFNAGYIATQTNANASYGVIYNNGVEASNGTSRTMISSSGVTFPDNTVQSSAAVFVDNNSQLYTSVNSDSNPGINSENYPRNSIIRVTYQGTVNVYLGMSNSPGDQYLFVNQTGTTITFNGNGASVLSANGIYCPQGYGGVVSAVCLDSSTWVISGNLTN